MELERIIIRDASEDDIEQLSNIEMLCFSMPWSPKEIKEQMESSSGARFIVAELEAASEGAAAEAPPKKLIGSVSAWYLPPWEIQIGNFAVLPEYRRQGVAGLLMDALLAKAEERGIPDISLEVRPSNAPALALYAKYGFLEEGRRRGYYQGKEDAIIMWRRGPAKEWKGLGASAQDTDR